jgi:D-amino-acid dehydrogenase
MFNPESPFFIRPRLDPELLRWLVQFARFGTAEHVHAVMPHFRDIQRLSLSLYQELIEAEGIACSFEQVGGLEVFLTEAGAASAAGAVAEARHFDLDTALLDRQQLLELEPALSDNVVAGIHYREDAHFEPGAFVQGLAQVLQNMGVTIQTGTQVHAINQKGGTAQVDTTAGTISPGQLLLAAGAWTSQLAKSAGLHVPMQAAKGYSITMERPEICPRIPLHLAEGRMAVTPMGTSMRFAGTLELSDINVDINERRVQAVQRAGERYLRDANPRVVKKVWAGMRPLPPDGVPYMGRVPDFENLLVATGHSMLGMSMGAATGSLMSQLLTGVPPDLDLNFYRVDRFAKK